MFHYVRAILVVTFGCIIATGAVAQTGMPAETRNAALRYWLAFAEMHDPPADKSVSDLLEKTAAGGIPYNEQQLGAILDANQTAILIFQRATKLPDCDWGLEYSQGPAASIAYVPRARVIARLNTLYGMRLAAKGDTQGAVNAWLAGVRFSQHIAKGGSLIFGLVAATALQSSLQALTNAAQSGSLDEDEKRQIESVVRSIPETGTDWGATMHYEEMAISVGLRQLSEASDPAAYYQQMTGRATPQSFSAPTAFDIAAFHKYMADEESALRLTPSATKSKAATIRAEASSVPLTLQSMIPNFARVNEVRINVRAARKALLDGLAVKGTR